LEGTYVRYARQNISAINTVDQLGGVAPRWQHVFLANLDQERWLGTLLYRYRQGYSEVINLQDGSRRNVGSYSIWDAQAQFALARSLFLPIFTYPRFPALPGGRIPPGKRQCRYIGVANLKSLVGIFRQNAHKARGQGRSAYPVKNVTFYFCMVFER
jgi:hypothetical protein